MSRLRGSIYIGKLTGSVTRYLNKVILVQPLSNWSLIPPPNWPNANVQLAGFIGKKTGVVTNLSLQVRLPSFQFFFCCGNHHNWDKT